MCLHASGTVLIIQALCANAARPATPTSKASVPGAELHAEFKSPLAVAYLFTLESELQFKNGNRTMP